MLKKKLNKKILNKKLQNIFYIDKNSKDSSEEFSLSESSISDYDILDVDIDNFVNNIPWHLNIPEYNHFNQHYYKVYSNNGKVISERKKVYRNIPNYYKKN